MRKDNQETVILGGGLAGLSAGHQMAKHDVPSLVLEAHHQVGGLARSVRKEGFSFDLGGHRFFSDKPELINEVKSLLDGELTEVGRKSRICLQGKLLDYPLKFPQGAFAMGIGPTVKILADYFGSILKRRLSPRKEESFEDWVVNRFGRALFNIYFEPYTEKVWGLKCTEISSAWAAARITLPNLGEALWRTVYKGGNEPRTIISQFLYPRSGVGAIADRLADRVKDGGGAVECGASVAGFRVKDGIIQAVRFKRDEEENEVPCGRVLSTIPIDRMTRLLAEAEGASPPPAVDRLKYRAVIFAFIMLNRPRVTDDTWVYFPDKDVIFGRFHEPRNWSADMAAEGKTSLCLEYFCNVGDSLWQMPSQELVDRSITHLERMAFLRGGDVQGYFVKRVSDAYPLFHVGYQHDLAQVKDYLGRFRNLWIAGRTGSFRYFNMDHAMEDGMSVAEKVLANRR